ncbi:MAG: NADP-dependent isocitrate dehydrogenase, partial [Deltaproteobacteria bacterium]|nr:NADP-dependent isocitrate dehydrogenase [Deltaproteobacteria bacterium]
MFEKIEIPEEGTRITAKDEGLVVPNDPIICFIAGDGVGSEISAV